MTQISDIFRLFNKNSNTAATIDTINTDPSIIQNKARLGDIASIGGGLLSSTAIVPGEEPNIRRGVVGGILSGAAAGPFGMLAGGLGGYLTAARAMEEYQNSLGRSAEQNRLDKTVNPSFYEEGGEVEQEYEEAQLSFDELILLPDGQIVKSTSNEKHKDMPKKEVTDMLPKGSQVFSNKLKFDTKKLKDEDIVLAKFPGVYGEDGNTKYEEIKLTDVIGEGEMTFAEAAKKVLKKIPTQDNKKDIYNKKTNDLNIETRIPHLMKLIELQTKQKNGKTK
jgi:hypothetical protein